MNPMIVMSTQTFIQLQATTTRLRRAFYVACAINIAFCIVTMFVH